MMIKRSLSELYRRVTAVAPDGVMADEALLAVVAKTDPTTESHAVLINTIARSAPHSAILRLLHALEPDTRQLNTDLARANTINYAQHHPARKTNTRTMRRTSRVPFALAACATLVLAVTAAQFGGVSRYFGAAGDSLVNSAHGDKIFDSAMDDTLVQQAMPDKPSTPDTLFQTDFSNG